MTLETTGIESEAVDEDLTPIGHVLMLDYDDVGLEAVQEDAETVRGPAVVVRSSARSYHLYGLEIRTWDDVVSALRSSRASSEYISEMIRRGVATLRTSSKATPDGQITAPAPAPIAVTMTRPGYKIPVSRPHAAQLRTLAEDAGNDRVARQLAAIETGAVDGLEPVGNQICQTRYETRGEVA